LNTWLKDNHNDNANSTLDDTVSHIWQQESLPTRNISAHQWNPDAPIFYSKHSKAMEYKDSDTQTEILRETETKSVGVTCKITPRVQGKYTQATASVKNQEVSAVAETQSVASQCQKTVRKIIKHDIGILCKQSPGAISRHSQTDRINLVGAQTNTKHTVVKHVATETEKEINWGGKMENYADVSDSNIGAGPELDYSQKRMVGKPGLLPILQNLEIQETAMDQFVENINNNHRNKRIKGVIKCGDDDEYWAIMDDLCFSISKTGTTYEANSYVKLYGEFVGLMCADDAKTEFSVVPDSPCYKQCEEALWNLPMVLAKIRSKHSCWTYGRGYSGGNDGYDGYGGSGRYGGYSGDLGGGFGKRNCKYQN
jgi:hypothetical protein